ncbi:MAG: single-stranded DNA-binding protein [Planctomycetes bacterium]|nr:single-stranded DNA-binding protein [Planctomycetota bacterium]
MGHISRAPELKYLQSNTAVVNFGIATNETYKGNDGEKKETVCFVDCFMYGKRAEALSKHFKKGDPIHLCGKLVFEQWEKDGVKNSKHKIKLDSWAFVQSKRKDDNDHGNNS